MSKEHHKPIGNRLTYEIDGEMHRLSWIAEHKPEFLIAKLCTEDWGLQPALLSALAKAGWDRPRIEKEAAEHPEWGADPGILCQI